MKKSEIASRVFDVVEHMPLTGLSGGPLTVPAADLAAVSLLPWFCEGCLHWAVRLSAPGQPFRRSPVKSIKTTSTTITPEGAALIGIPGDGIDPSTWALFPLAEEIAAAVKPGMSLELAAANLGIVKRDSEAESETKTTHGDQRYVGVIDAESRWVIEQTVPALTRPELEAALGCARAVVSKGPWPAANEDEAVAALVQWFASPEANTNPMSVKYFFRFENGAFRNTDEKMNRKLPGLGLGFFRVRLSGSGFRWETGPLQGIHTWAELEEIARSIVHAA